MVNNVKGVKEVQGWYRDAIMALKSAKSESQKSVAVSLADDCLLIIESMVEGKNCECGDMLVVDTCDVCGELIAGECMYCHLDAHACIDDSNVLSPHRQLISEMQYEGPDEKLTFIV